MDRDVEEIMQHQEGFCWMTYRSDDGTESIRIWNSRDGVTPFVITLPSGKQATHVDWHADHWDPGYEPKPGDLIFVDMTDQAAREYAQRNAERYFNDAKLSQFVPPSRTVEELAQALYESYTDVPGSPNLVRVKEDGSYENV